MMLINCSPNGIGTIFLPDDATDDEIWKACYIDATEKDGNGKEKKGEKE